MQTAPRACKSPPRPGQLPPRPRQPLRIIAQRFSAGSLSHERDPSPATGRQKNRLRAQRKILSRRQPAIKLIAFWGEQSPSWSVLPRMPRAGDLTGCGVMTPSKPGDHERWGLFIFRIVDTSRFACPTLLPASHLAISHVNPIRCLCRSRTISHIPYSKRPLKRRSPSCDLLPLAARP